VRKGDTGGDLESPRHAGKEEEGHRRHRHRHPHQHTEDSTAHSNAAQYNATVHANAATAVAHAHAAAANAATNAEQLDAQQADAKGDRHATHHATQHLTQRAACHAIADAGGAAADGGGAGGGHDEPRQKRRRSRECIISHTNSGGSVGGGGAACACESSAASECLRGYERDRESSPQRSLTTAERAPAPHPAGEARSPRRRRAEPWPHEPLSIGQLESAALHLARSRQDALELAFSHQHAPPLHPSFPAAAPLTLLTQQAAPGSMKHLLARVPEHPPVSAARPGFSFAAAFAAQADYGTMASRGSDRNGAALAGRPLAPAAGVRTARASLLGQGPLVQGVLYMGPAAPQGQAGLHPSYGGLHHSAAVAYPVGQGVLAILHGHHNFLGQGVQGFAGQGLQQGVLSPAHAASRAAPSAAKEAAGVGPGRSIAS